MAGNHPSSPAFTHPDREQRVAADHIIPAFNEEVTITSVLVFQLPEHFGQNGRSALLKNTVPKIAIKPEVVPGVVYAFYPLRQVRGMVKIGWRKMPVGRFYRQGDQGQPQFCDIGLPLSLEPKRTLSANLTFGRSERATGGASKSLPARSRLNEAEAMLPPLIAVEKALAGSQPGSNAIKDPLAISMATFKRRRTELVQKRLAYQSKSDDRWQLSSKYVERLAKPGKWQ